MKFARSSFHVLNPNSVLGKNNAEPITRLVCFSRPSSTRARSGAETRVSHRCWRACAVLLLLRLLALSPGIRRPARPGADVVVLATTSFQDSRPDSLKCPDSSFKSCDDWLKRFRGSIV